MINSFCKYFSMTGWRLGWMVVPERIGDVVERLGQNLYICAPACQPGGRARAFDCEDELDAHVRRYAENRPALIEGLADAGIDRVANADGAFYVYADVSPMLACRRRRRLDGARPRWLADIGVATSPGVDFDLDDGGRWLRLCYAGPNQDVAEAASLIARWSLR